MFIKKKEGEVATELLILLIAVVLISGGVLFLIKSGILEVNPENAQTDVLNTDFLPTGREGILLINEFEFCAFVDVQYNCIDERNIFSENSEVHVKFVVQTTPLNGDVMLVENYLVRDPNGEIILSVDQKENFQFEAKSSRKEEEITFKDFFILGEGAPHGKYTFELLLTNPLLGKKATLSRDFTIASWEEAHPEEPGIYETEEHI